MVYRPRLPPIKQNRMDKKTDNEIEIGIIYSDFLV